MLAGAGGWGRGRHAQMAQLHRVAVTLGAVLGSWAVGPEGPCCHAAALPGVSTPKSLCALTFAPGGWGPACISGLRRGGASRGTRGSGQWLGLTRGWEVWPLRVPVLPRGMPQHVVPHLLSGPPVQGAGQARSVPGMPGL